jgi:hypothetical protein
MLTRSHLSLSSRLVIGGSNADTGLSSTVLQINDATFAASSWSVVSTGAFDPPRYQHCALVYNTANVVVFGGLGWNADLGGYESISDTWLV